jgi:D-glycero-beta-D-manno-heptose-7-phosphate kinase
MDIQQLGQFKILVIGDSCSDIYHYGTCDRLSPEAPIPIFKESRIESRAGMSANVAANLRSLGAKVQHFHNKEEIRKHRYVDSKSKQQLLRVDSGENINMVPFDVKEINHNEYDAIVVSDYNKGFLTSKECGEVCEFAKRNNIPLFVDSKKNDLSCFNSCYVKINEVENQHLKKQPINSELIITLGDRGVMYAEEIFPTDKVEVFDVCGAGDVFLSTLILFFLLTTDLRYGIIKGNKCATFSVTKMGTYVLTKEDIKAMQL